MEGENPHSYRPSLSSSLRPATIRPTKRKKELVPSLHFAMMKKTSGRKKASGTAAAAADGTAAGNLKKVHGDWQRSSMTERHLEALRRDRHLPSLEKMKTRAPGDEVTPTPKMTNA